MVIENFEIVRNPGIETCEAVMEMYNGWVYSIHDYKTWYKALGDKFNHWVLIDKANNEIIGSVFSVIFDSPKILTIGQYFLKPEYRGKGLGIPLWDKALEGDCENMALFAVGKMSPYYAKRDGFDKFTSFDALKVSLECKNFEFSRLDSDASLKIVDKTSVNWDDFMKFDNKFTDGLDRSAYLKAFFNQPGAYNKIVTDRNDEILGYCNVRECYANTLIVGPFYAVNKSAASTVFRSVIEIVPNFKTFEKLKMTVPSNNTDMLELLKTATDDKFNIDATNYIQFTKKLLDIPGEKIYAFTECTLSYC